MTYQNLQKSRTPSKAVSNLSISRHKGGSSGTKVCFHTKFNHLYWKGVWVSEGWIYTLGFKWNRCWAHVMNNWPTDIEWLANWMNGSKAYFVVFVCIGLSNLLSLGRISGCDDFDDSLLVCTWHGMKNSYYFICPSLLLLVVSFTNPSIH